MREEKKKLLFPANPLMHVGLGNDYVDYMLSGVLATHGYTIRDIRPDGDEMIVTCKSEREENPGRVRIHIHPMSPMKNEHPFVLHWHDLRLRYYVKEEDFQEPVWLQAISYGVFSSDGVGVALLDSEKDQFVCM